VTTKVETHDRAVLVFWIDLLRVELVRITPKCLRLGVKCHARFLNLEDLKENIPVCVLEVRCPLDRDREPNLRDAVLFGSAGGQRGIANDCEEADDASPKLLSEGWVILAVGQLLGDGIFLEELVVSAGKNVKGVFRRRLATAVVGVEQVDRQRNVVKWIYRRGKVRSIIRVVGFMLSLFSMTSSLPVAVRSAARVL
jgi:hypothetical protein